jgi:hypothetical protein
MKTRIAILIALMLITLLIAGMLVQNTAGTVQIQLRSNPFPMTVGSATLQIAILDKNGTAIEDAVLQVTTQLSHPGAPAIIYYPNQLIDGLYQVPVVWSMMGQGSVRVSAELPSQAETIEEQFSVFIYLVPPVSTNNQSTYRSFDEISRDVTANLAQEYWIVIPQGAREMMTMGQGEDIVPAQIRLNLNGQNTLVIRNDDFADHTIGPFFVRAGETIRQEFTQPAVFVGDCSIRHSSEIRIIIEQL